ncbi:MAG: Rne/Rng family ribonuclease [Firmicutes bacterium]|nr:Rne/Rng family ribonuclease [Bacillota bacterium]
MKRILVDSSNLHTKVGYVENGELIEFVYESECEKSLVGNIYAGRVTSVHKGMQACFIDIGQKKSAYMTISNNSSVKTGSQIIVQVQKDASGAKGAGVTDKISFPGKFVVLIPNDGGNIGVSNKINGAEERERIREIASKAVPEGYGMIVRTEGEGKTFDEFKEESECLKKLCETVLNSGRYIKAPALLHSEGSAAVKAARDLFGDDVDEIVLNDVEEYNAVKNGTHNRPERVVFYDSPVPMFENYFVQSQADKIFGKKVWLKSGGFIIIEQTEACVVIDVNTGKYTGKRDFQETILKTNIEAAAEIAKQLRLRNLSGMIIVDFIDMKHDENKKILRAALERAVRKDRIKTTVVGLTELGLMQITRKKTSVPVAAKIMEECRFCHGHGSVPATAYIAGEMRRRASAVLSQTIYNKVTVFANKKLLCAFAGENDVFLNELEKKHSAKVVMEEKEMLSEHFEVKGEKDEKI